MQHNNIVKYNCNLKEVFSIVIYYKMYSCDAMLKIQETFIIITQYLKQCCFIFL